MKSLIATIIMSLSIVAFAGADYLTCDLQFSERVTKYRIDLNGDILPAGVENVGINQVRINYNIDHLENGKYVVTAAAGNDEGEWSAWSDELIFYRGVPTPQNIGLYCVSEKSKRISQENWVVYHVSSEEIKNEGLLAPNAIDGNPETQWHSSWTTSEPDTSRPHEIQIDLGREYTIQGFYYLPRQDASWNGTIKKFVFYTSRDGKNWTETASGSFDKTKNEQFVRFTSISAKYISIVSLSEVNNREWTTVAEINVLGY